MTKFKFEDGTCLKGKVSGTKLVLHNEESGEKGEVDLVNLQKIRITSEDPPNIEFTTHARTGKVVETYTMHIRGKDKYFIWFVTNYDFEEEGSLSGILMGIGTDDPRHGRGHYVGGLSDTSIELNIQIKEKNEEISVILQVLKFA